MDVEYYIGVLGLVLLLTGIFLLLIFQYEQAKIIKKWKARENKWVNEGYQGFGVRLIRENNPPSLFQEEFNNRLIKRFGWLGCLSLVGFVLILISGN